MLLGNCNLEPKSIPVATLRTMATKVLTKLTMEYFNKFEGDSPTNMEDILRVLVKVCTDLPVRRETTKAETAQEFYKRVLKVINNQTTLSSRESIYNHKAYYSLNEEEMEVLAAELGMKLIKAAEKLKMYMLLMYLYSGLRMGEGIPLTWEDIDLEKRTIRVNKKAIVCHDYASHSAPQVVQDFCKTKSSKRKVVITAGLVGILKEHKAEMIKRVEQSGEEWSESHLVFPNTRGNMVHNRNLQNSLYRIFAKCGIEGATMHTLRHTYATRCFEAGVDIKAISEQLGHANVKTTYNIYVHLLEDTKEKEIDKLQGIDKLLA